MKTVKIEMELPEPPEGFEYTGEYRVPNHAEPYLCESVAYCNNGHSKCPEPVFILRKKRWRAEQGEYFWYVTTMTGCLDKAQDRWCMADSLYAIGNYFQTQEQAQQALDKFKQILKEINL